MNKIIHNEIDTGKLKYQITELAPDMFDITVHVPIQNIGQSIRAKQGVATRFIKTMDYQKAIKYGYKRDLKDNHYSYQYRLFTSLI